jgi:uncharacterized protein (DUF2336 family)
MAATQGQAMNVAEREGFSDAAARENLLRRLSDLAVLPLGRLTRQERGLIDTVVATALSRLDVPTRRRLAERIAQLPEGPPDLTLALARDEIEIAAPVLRNSLGLQPGDLAQIVREMSDEHRLAVSARKNLPGAVVDALIESANRDSICRMLANPDAEISVCSLEILVRRSASEPAYHPLLLARQEMNVRLAQLMFWWVSTEARNEILTRFAIDRRMMHNALDDVLESGIAASATDDVLQIALSLVRPPVTITKHQVQRLVDQASRHQRDAFIAEMVYAGRIRPETAFRIFSDPGGEPIAVFAKAIGMTRAEFGDLLAVLTGFYGVDLTVKAIFNRIAATFDIISNDRADLMLHCWDWAISAEAQLPIDV